MVNQIHLSVLTVNYVVQDGKSNWLEGMILMCKFQLYFGLCLCSPLCRFILDLGCHVLVLPWYVTDSNITNYRGAE
jgi:hypothetical protein